MFFESRSLLRSHISVVMSHDVTGGASTCSAKRELSSDVFIKVNHTLNRSKVMLRNVKK